MSALHTSLLTVLVVGSHLLMAGCTGSDDSPVVDADPPVVAPVV